MAEENCQTFCQRQCFFLRKTQREILIRVYKIQKENGFAINKDFKDFATGKKKKHNRKLYYNVGKLITDGYIENTSTEGVFNLKVTEKGEQYLKALLGELQFNTPYVSILDRPNGITINQPIKYRPKDIIPAGFKSSNSDKLHWSMPQLTYSNSEVSIRITPATVSYYFKGCYSPDPHHAVNVCLNSAFKFSKFLQDNGFKLDLPNTAIVQQEHALFNKELSKFGRRYNIHYKSDVLTFDLSISDGEFELIHPETSADDFIRVTDFLEAVASGKITVQSILDLQKLLQNQQEDVQIVKP